VLLDINCGKPLEFDPNQIALVSCRKDGSEVTVLFRGKFIFTTILSGSDDWHKNQPAE
jgi:hypothetical protein